jgi:SAM-dependent methyltransferase
LAKTRDFAPNRNAAHPFDLKYGTDTGGYLSPEQLRNGQTRDALNNGYSAVAPSVFREACRRWRETLPSSMRVEAYTFVDVGAGKGRALLFASELAFRRVIGVEMNEDLALVAQRNIAAWSRITHPRGKIRVMHRDAADFRWPRAPLLV